MEERMAASVKVLACTICQQAHISLVSCCERSEQERFSLPQQAHMLKTVEDGAVLLMEVRW